MPRSISVTCPICQTSVPWDSESQYRPFCSDRCRILDLGDWASGKHAIPSDAENDDTTAADLNRDGQ